MPRIAVVFYLISGQPITVIVKDEAEQSQLISDWKNNRSNEEYILTAGPMELDPRYIVGAMKHIINVPEATQPEAQEAGDTSSAEA